MFKKTTTGLCDNCPLTKTETNIDSDGHCQHCYNKRMALIKVFNKKATKPSMKKCSIMLKKLPTPGKSFKAIIKIIYASL